MRSLSPLHVAVAAFVGILLLQAAPSQQPVDSPFQSGYALPVGFAYHGTDLMFVYERRGVVRVVDHGTLLAAPLIDLEAEVGGWRDFGMLGFALDPDFANNGHYYLSYVVDRHHLLHHGTPSYDAATDEYYAATIMRVARYTADVATGFTTTVPGSRLVLFGESASTGGAITYESHGTGQLAFGSDGTLLVGVGDGASYLAEPDIGSAPETYYQQALVDGILRPEENVGAFRAQMITSFSGKILRLDPTTGDGLPSNPFWDPAQPRSPRSRIWALGFRNPFRMCVRPGTGSSDPSLGEPGTIYLGDVHWVTREELNVVHHGGHNFGWPLYEGITPCPQFTAALVANQDAPNPLVGLGGCSQAFFHFQDLLLQAQDSHIAFFPNPCDPMVGIASTTPTFLHTPPVLDWHHSQDDARVPGFENDRLVTYLVGSPESGVPGPQFHGGCSVGGCWHSGITFPPGFGPCYYHADFAEGWIRRLEFDAEDELVAVHDLAEVQHPMMLGEHPLDHSLVYVSLQDQLRKLAFGIEPAPVAMPTADVTYGSGAFQVQLDARDSFDPEGQPLTYFWDLGYGRTSTSPQLGLPLHGSGVPSMRQIALTVTDPFGTTGTATLDVGIDNTPPAVAIASFANGDTYSLAAPTNLPLVADVVDAEHGPTQLAYVWTTNLHHESHTHPEPPNLQPTTSTVISPTPVGHQFFAYSIDLTVTDAGGLSTTVRHWLFPDTSGASTSVLMTAPAIGDRVLLGEAVELQALTTGSVQRVEYYVEDELVGIATTPPYAVSWTPTRSGTQTAMVLAVGTDATSSNTRGIPFVVEQPTVTMVRGTGSLADAVEALMPAAAPVANGQQLLFGDDGTPRLCGMHFSVPAMPVGARVLSAAIDFVAAQSDAGAARLQIRSEANASPNPIGTTIGDLSRRKTGPATVTWSPPDWIDGDSGPAQRTPDLSALIQPTVDHPKWNGSLMLLVRGAGLRRAVTWNGDPLTGPVLRIAWLPPLSPLQNLPVVADGDEDLGTGSVDLDLAELHLGEHLGATRRTALQFIVKLPHGTRIESAHIRFTSAGNDLGPALFTIRIQDSDDATPLMTAPYDISARPQAPDTVSWFPPEWPTPGAAGNDQRSPDVAALVEQVLARPGWQPGNQILLVVEGTGSRTAASFDAGLGNAPVLELTYRLP